MYWIAQVWLSSVTGPHICCCSKKLGALYFCCSDILSLCIKFGDTDVQKILTAWQSRERSKQTKPFWLKKSASSLAQQYVTASVSCCHFLLFRSYFWCDWSVLDRDGCLKEDLAVFVWSLSLPLGLLFAFFYLEMPLGMMNLQVWEQVQCVTTFHWYWLFVQPTDHGILDLWDLWSSFLVCLKHKYVYPNRRFRTHQFQNEAIAIAGNLFCFFIQQ